MRRFALVMILASLVACTPTLQAAPPARPLVFATSYRALFDATLQELTAAYTGNGYYRQYFSVSQANPETGLITAVRNENGQNTTAAFEYRWGREDTPEFNLFVPFPVQQQAPQSFITVVVRPAGRHASLIYSSQAAAGGMSAEANELMQQVVQKLRARFNQLPSAPASISGVQMVPEATPGTPMPAAPQ